VPECHGTLLRGSDPRGGRHEATVARSPAGYKHAEEVMAAAAQHGREVHGLRDEDLTPDVTDRVAAAIRSV
jgi:predicted small metal-binding protein